MPPDVIRKSGKRNIFRTLLIRILNSSVSRIDKVLDKAFGQLHNLYWYFPVAVLQHTWQMFESFSTAGGTHKHPDWHSTWWRLFFLCLPEVTWPIINKGFRHNQRKHRVRYHLYAIFLLPIKLTEAKILFWHRWNTFHIFSFAKSELLEKRKTSKILAHEVILVL